MALYHLPLTGKSNRLTVDDLTSIDETQSVAGKIQKLVSLLEIPPEQLETRRKECAELRELIRKYYPDCMLLAFGSTVNGFGLKYSDLDLLFLPFPGYCNIDYAPKVTEKKAELPPKENEKKTDLPDPASILSNETPKDILMKFDEFQHLRFLKSIFKKEKKVVQKFYMIPSKHNPTIRANFISSKIILDLAASNRLVVYNSELLEYYGKYDPRVKPLVIALRFWAHSLGLMKKFFSSYGFILMVIFFLQNTNPAILIPVKRLMEMAKYNRVIAGWQTAITDVPPPKSKNTESLEELLLNFFQFYWNFDFSQNVISIYYGKAVLIKDIKNSKDKRMEDFAVAAINIQDPFVLSRNCCRKEGSHSVLKLAFYTAYQMLQDKSGKFKFTTMFDNGVYNKLFRYHFDRYSFVKQKNFIISFDYECAARMSKSTKASATWYERVTRAIFDVLQYGLLMDCEVIDQKSWATYNSTNDMETNGTSVVNLMDASSVKNSPFQLELLMSLQCFVYTRVWVGRKQITEVTEEIQDEFEEFSHPVLKTEYNLSKKIVKNNPALDSPQPLLWFKCECYKHSSPQISEIVIILKPLVDSKEFYTVFMFLQSFLSKTVKKIIAS